MPPIRSSTFTCYAFLTASISFNRKIISSYSHCTKKGLVYVIIIFLASRQSSFYFKCTKANTRLLYNVRLVPLNKYRFLHYTRYYIY